MLPLDVKAAMLKLEETQKALEDFVESGSPDKVKAAELIAAQTTAMTDLTTVLTKFSEGNSIIQ